MPDTEARCLVAGSLTVYTDLLKFLMMYRAYTCVSIAHSLPILYTPFLTIYLVNVSMNTMINLMVITSGSRPIVSMVICWP